MCNRRQSRWRKWALLLVASSGIGWYGTAPFRSQPIVPIGPAESCPPNLAVAQWPVALCARIDTPGDNGPVTITVLVDGKSVGTIVSDYNYDTLMNVPAGYTSYRWLDDDWHLDLIIDPHSLQTGRPLYYVGSRTGRLTPLHDTNIR
ncbi:MAG: hypothetical protein HY696_08585 [Deltaproteobacteria bacterium]|nr:hypothetical protein [Deltaproteobacteria bacterium]